MKKIISIFVTLSIMISATTFATVVSAANPTDPTLKVTLHDVVQSSDEVAYATGTTFKLTVSYENLPAWESEDTYEGISLAGLGFNLSLPGYGTYYEQYSSKAFLTETLKKEAGGTAVKNLDGTTYIYTWAGGIAADDSWRQPSGDIITLYLKVTNDMTENNVFELSEAKLQAGNFNSSDEWTHDTIYTVAYDNLNLQSAEIEITSSQGGSKEAVQAGDTFTDAAGAQAVAYYVDLDSTASEKTGRWYATIGDTAMKTVNTFAIPNISAENVMLGLVYKGAETVSDVVFKWE